MRKSIPKSKPSTQATPGPKKPVKPPLDTKTPPKRTPCGGKFNPN